MLVLSREKFESVIIGDNEIVLTVVDFRGPKVRLGFDAPHDVPIHRAEVYTAIKGAREPIGSVRIHLLARIAELEQQVRELVGHAPLSK